MTSSPSVPALLEPLRSGANPQRKWRAMLGAIATTVPSVAWAELPEPQLERDVARARTWLVDDLAKRDAPHPVRGLYFGLDLRNMNGPAGFNVEMSATRGCDPEGDDALWVWNCEWRGRRHRIESLRAISDALATPAFAAVHEHASTWLPLGYAGLVLSVAVAELPVQTPVLAVYGFHDGDLFALARRSPHDVEVLASPVER